MEYVKKSQTMRSPKSSTKASDSVNSRQIIDHTPKNKDEYWRELNPEEASKIVSPSKENTTDRKIKKNTKLKIKIDKLVIHNIDEGSNLKVEWSRNKFNASTPFLKVNGNETQFDYVFEINTILQVNESTNKPNTSKLGKLKVIKEDGNELIAEAEFNMNAYGIEEYQEQTLKLKMLKEESKENNFLFIALQGDYPEDNVLSAENLKKMNTVNYSSPMSNMSSP